MKTVTTVLNSRKGADPRWPGEMYLAFMDLDEIILCCLGCNALACGISLDDLYGLNYPSGLGTWDDPWSVHVPEEILLQLSELLDINLFVMDPKAEQVAATINDEIAVGRDNPDLAVEALRILFRYVGETIGERWIIRYLKD